MRAEELSLHNGPHGRDNNRGTPCLSSSCACLWLFASAFDHATFFFFFFFFRGLVVRDSQRFLSRIQRIRLALRDGDAECKELEQKIRRSKLNLEKQLLREKKAVETEQKYKVGFAKVKLRLEEEKDREQEMLRQLRCVAQCARLLTLDVA